MQLVQTDTTYNTVKWTKDSCLGRRWKIDKETNSEERNIVNGFGLTSVRLWVASIPAVLFVKPPIFYAIAVFKITQQITRNKLTIIIFRFTCESSGPAYTLSVVNPLASLAGLNRPGRGLSSSNAPWWMGQCHGCICLCSTSSGPLSIIWEGLRKRSWRCDACLPHLFQFSELRQRPSWMPRTDPTKHWKSCNILK